MSITGDVVRGSLIWLNLYPKAGHEQAGYRPAIVVSDGLIDPTISDLAFIVPVTNQVKGYAFEVPVPQGIAIDGALVHTDYIELGGAALTDHAKSLDLSARNATVIGQIDPDSPFYKQVVSYVRSILA
ncbi:type II toxin-antitoxin system PemK/MazF family toxin [Paenibacillus caui]|uniref:type II toxin-antitoxin system PemK/MazF family toxin n=1 Tax=Paenibacillus caui TaxID=2873927 RepID=UPI001CA854FA|nr:type II toxin-antitoxin system PemK/MazF family toxin [Paenibacillus caui]